jgi:hypothetical protein
MDDFFDAKECAIMLLFWRVRFLDTRDGQFKDRDLWLDTNALDPVIKAAVETAHGSRRGGNRGMLQFRGLFEEKVLNDGEFQALCERHGGMDGVSIPDYFEDESSRELTFKEMAVVLTGNPDAVMLPAGAAPHDVEYMNGDPRPIAIDQVVVSPEQLRVLGYFARDLGELQASAFYKDGAGTLSSRGDEDWVLKTAISDEEIRSFVTIFRRLYMEGEPANLANAVRTFEEAVPGHRLSRWVRGVHGQYEELLRRPPDVVPSIGRGKVPFSQKRLIDVYLYTRYAHQPSERRARQFQECLAAVGGNRDLLTWLFLTAIWHSAVHMWNGGRIIANFFGRYCQYHALGPDLLQSLAHEHPGFGTLEKREQRASRILHEKAGPVASVLWERAGRPEGGPQQFLKPAIEQITAAMGADPP